MSPDDKGDLAAPRVDKTGPAGVKYDVLPVSGAEADGRVVKGLPGVLEDCRENSKKQMATSDNFQADTGKQPVPVQEGACTHSFCEYPT